MTTLPATPAYVQPAASATPAIDRHRPLIELSDSLDQAENGVSHALRQASLLGLHCLAADLADLLNRVRSLPLPAGFWDAAATAREEMHGSGEVPF